MVRVIVRENKFRLFITSIIHVVQNTFCMLLASTIVNNQLRTGINEDTITVVRRLIGVALIGAAFIAIGLFVSSLTENQLSAAVVTIGVIAGMILLNLFNLLSDSDGQPLIASYAIRAVIDWISVLSRFSNFSNGIFDYAALLYYVSLSFVFLFLTVRVYEKRRWG